MPSFTSVLTDITQLLALTPTILQLIVAIEQIFAANGMNAKNGAAKKEVMAATLKAAGISDHLMEKALKMNDGLVESLNKNGVLQTVANNADGCSVAPPVPPVS